MLDILKKYEEIIRDYHITSFDQETGSFRIKIEIIFIDESRLFVKDFSFKNSERKYSYHWTDSKGDVLCRWDNSPHWENITTFPHHKHIQSKVFDSRETTIEQVLDVINTKLVSMSQRV